MTKQELKGRRTGNGVVWNCFVCPKYQDKNDMTICKNTLWKCHYCGMPLCNAHRKGTNGRTDNCTDKHLDTDDALFACNDTYFNGKEVPKSAKSTYVQGKRRGAVSTLYRCVVVVVGSVDDLVVLVEI